jgi:hypothetical protein
VRVPHGEAAPRAVSCDGRRPSIIGIWRRRSPIAGGFDGKSQGDDARRSSSDRLGRTLSPGWIPLAAASRATVRALLSPCSSRFPALIGHPHSPFPRAQRHRRRCTTGASPGRRLNTGHPLAVQRRRLPNPSGSTARLRWRTPKSRRDCTYMLGTVSTHVLAGSLAIVRCTSPVTIRRSIGRHSDRVNPRRSTMTARPSW